MQKLIQFIQKFFYTFLDISGILLGLFLIGLGWWVQQGKPVAHGMGWIVVLLGVAAFLIHATHFTVAQKRGSEYFYTTRNKKRNPDRGV